MNKAQEAALAGAARRAGDLRRTIGEGAKLLRFIARRRKELKPGSTVGFSVNARDSGFRGGAHVHCEFPAGEAFAALAPNIRDMVRRAKEELAAMELPQ